MSTYIEELAASVGLYVSTWSPGDGVMVEYRDGERQYVRSRLYGLACITAQVIQYELERAYARGRQDEREGIAREVFA